MAVPQGVWGIDIGQCALKALRVELVDGQVTATAFDYIEHPKILTQPDADPDQLTREALEKFLARNQLKGDVVAIAVPGQSGLARFVKLPPVEEKKINDIVRFEAKQQIPFPLEEVVWDYQKIGAGSVTDGFAMETEIGLFAMKRDQISRHLQHFQEVNVEVQIVQMAPLALCNFVAYDLLNKGGAPDEAVEEEEDAETKGKRKCVVALDIGTDSSNLVITDGEKIIWQRPIPLGGNHLTRALSKDLKLTFAKAEHLKRNAAKSPPELKTILAALKPVLTDFVGEAQRSLGYFTNTHRDANVAYVVGLGSAFRLPGLQKYLSEKLQIDVRKPTKLARLHGDEVTESPVFSENVLSFAVAYGLAVQGLQVARLQTNLLPQEIRFDRLIRAKKPWAVAAASALFLGAGLLAGGYAINYNAVNATAINTQMKSADDVVKRVTDFNTAVDGKQNTVKQTADEVKSIIAGKDEQLNWIRLNQFIDLCLPQPEGTNLKWDKMHPLDPTKGVVNQVKYWNTEPARESARQYRERLTGSVSNELPLDDETRSELCHVDIERIETAFASNLKAFYDNARPASKELSGEEFNGMIKYDLDNPPKETDAGWVIALYGSTYRKENRDFLLDTLIFNLTTKMRNKLEVFAPAADATAAAPAAAPATPAGEAPKPAAANADPVLNNVSHVFLYGYWAVKEPKLGVFQYINQDYVRPLVASGVGAAGGAAGTMPPGAGILPPGSGGESGGSSIASSRDTWVPLAGLAGTSNMPGGFGGIPGGSGGFGGMPGGTFRGSIPGGAKFAGSRFRGGVMGGDLGGRGPEAGGNPAGEAPGTVKGKPRYEFVAVFIWREPTPSDALMKTDAGNAPVPTKQ